MTLISNALQCFVRKNELNVSILFIREVMKRTWVGKHGGATGVSL